MERNRTIDLLKFVFSVCVIAVHAQIFKEVFPIGYNTITMGLFRIAVPFFFVVSGYYYYQRLQNQNSGKDYLKNLMNLFVKFECVELIVFGVFVYFSNPSILIFLRKIFTVGLGGAYWYIISMILSLVLLTPFWKKKNIYLGLFIGLILYLWTMTYDSYSIFFTHSFLQKMMIAHTEFWTWPQAGLNESLFFLSLGALLHKFKEVKGIEMITAISIIGLFIESYILQAMHPYDGNTYLSLIILAPSLVLVCFKYPNVSFETKRLGKMSIYIYMIHQLVLNVFSYTLPLGRELKFVLTLIVVVFIADKVVKRKETR